MFSSSISSNVSQMKLLFTNDFALILQQYSVYRFSVMIFFSISQKINVDVPLIGVIIQYILWLLLLLMMIANALFLLLATIQRSLRFNCSIANAESRQITVHEIYRCTHKLMNAPFYFIYFGKYNSSIAETDRFN